jgi:hypothetical protein
MLVRRALLLIACCAALAVHADEPPVGWRDAARCVDRFCTVTGTVVESETIGPTIRLYFDAHDRTFRVLLMRAWLVTWPPYGGETVAVTGKVQRFHDHLEMIVRDPGDVVVIGGTPTATATPPAPPGAASPPLAATPTPGEVEQLRERVRELEQRIKDLEGR